MEEGVQVRDGRIEIRTPYTEQNLENARVLPDREFSPDPDPHWWVPATPWHAKAVLNLFPGLPGASQIAPLLAGTNEVEVKVPDGLARYQIEAVKFIKSAGGKAFIGDDPGTGKTIVALGWCYDRGSKLGRVLIIAPTVVLYKWEREIHKWLGEGKSVQVVDKVKTPILLDTQFILMSYAMLRLRVEELVALNYDLLVLDEAHHVKTGKAQQTKAAIRVGGKSAHRINLSGKPFLNQPGELFYPLHILMPEAFPDWFRFVSRYTMGKYQHWTGMQNGMELQSRLESVLLRRTKNDVLTELPPIRRVLLPFRLEDKDMKEYRKVEDEVIFGNPLVACTAMRRAVANAKKQTAVDWARNFLEENPESKLIVYAYHLDVMGHINVALESYGSAIIDGSLSAKEREHRANRFQESRVPRVLVINTAANEGIDLYRSSNVLFAEREWVPNTEEQAESRCHRKGQKDSVTAWYLEAKDTFDEHLAAVIERKRAIFEDVLRADEIQETVMWETIELMRAMRRRENENQE